MKTRNRSDMTLNIRVDQIKRTTIIDTIKVGSTMMLS